MIYATELKNYWWNGATKGVQETPSAIYMDRVKLDDRDDMGFKMTAMGERVPNTPENFAAAMQWLEEVES